MLNIALFGPPGAGKGTQAHFLVKKYNLTYISTGEILRNEIETKTEIGEEVKKIIERGEFVDDGIIVKIIENIMKMQPDSNGILFDGFPRTYAQAYILEGLLSRLNTSLSCFLSLEVPRDELISRMLKRGETENRPDDQIDVIENRLNEYNKKTLPVIDFYKERNKCYKIDGLGSVEEIFARITGVVEKILAQTLINIVFFGVPGAGKGTQAKIIAKKFNLKYVSTGQLIRKEIENNTEIGKIAKPYMDSGDIVPDDIAIKLIEREINDPSNINGYIFKGFPSTLVQAYILSGLLKKINSSVSLVIELKTPTSQSLKRLSARAKTKEARSYDMSTDIIMHRLDVFEKTTKKVLDFYKPQKIKSFDGNIEDELLTNQISEVVENTFKEVRK